MILHDVCDLSISLGVDQYNDPLGFEVTPGIPCELTPLNSIPASDYGTLKTRYAFVTDVDLGALAAAHGASIFTINYPSGSAKTLAFEAGFERHTVLGRFHHIEAIALDFGL